MCGSGLKSALEYIFGKNTIDHILTGKAYARAVRGHLLVQSALVNILLRSIVPDPEMSKMQSQVVSFADDSDILHFCC